jgi:hypothetical protein
VSELKSSSTERRDWNWDTDGPLEGLYVETRSVTVKNGPSAGKEKLVFDFHVGLDDEAVSVWETAVLRSKFREELRSRKKTDFEDGEQITITPTGKKTSVNGTYRDFDVTFEHAAPKRTAAELLDDTAAGNGGGGEPDDGIPFRPTINGVS